MTPAEAANFVISGTEIIKGGEILVKKMPAFKLGDLVDVMINEFGPRFEQDPDNINVEIMGEGPGERSHEKLISEDEIKISNEYEDLFAIYPNIEEISRSISIENSLKGEYNSARATHLSKEEIINIVDEYMRNND
jgi:FlaA1/EpsC-like NDP-sugar epimerase